MEIGSCYLGDRQCQFTVWAPQLQQVAVHLTAPVDQVIPLEKNQQGYWQGRVEAEPGSLYFYQLDGTTDRPDPASRSQPQGVHGASEVVDPHFNWMDQAWQSVPLEKMVVYELHVGTFTPEGTFEAIIPRIPELLELGVTAIELMPVAQYPGDRNWGYDGVYLYAPQQSYGGVAGLKQLVNACHQQGMAVLLDVIYNHFGPEGNYISCYGPYFTQKYKTPWGCAINFDGSYSYGVRNFLIENALYWLREFHLDGLRLDATDNIFDQSAKHFLQELSEAVTAFSQQQGRKYYLMAESDLNDARWIRPSNAGGFGIDVHWNDDFHHTLHALLTGESVGYYADYGSLEQVAKAYTHNFVYTWNFSNNRNRYHGSDPSEFSPLQFLVFCQNHDQVGNRLLGDRLCHLIPFEARKLVAAAVLLSPSIPLLFMGEEYGELAPFQYFVSHSDPDLIAAVRQGRREEFAAFHAESEALDPQSEEVFQGSKLNWELRHQGEHQILWRFYQTLLRLRRELPALGSVQRDQLEAVAMAETQVLKLRRWCGNSQVLCLLNFNSQPSVITMEAPGTWKKLLNSADPEWGGTEAALVEMPNSITLASASCSLTLQPHSVLIYTNL